MDKESKEKFNNLLKEFNSPEKKLSEAEIKKLHEQIVEVRADYAPSQRYLLRSYMALHQLDLLEKTAEAILLMDPQDTDSFFHLAYVYAFSHRYSEALEYFRILGKHDSRYAELYKVEQILEKLISVVHSNRPEDGSLRSELEKNLRENINHLVSSKNSVFVQRCQSETLVIAFTGFANKLHMPTSQFFEEAKLTELSKIIVFDSSFQKTLGGLQPYANTFEEFIEFLKKEIRLIGPKKVITVGCSGGGHTALLSGHLLQVDAAFAFSPFPYLTHGEGIPQDDPLQNSPAFHRINELAERAGQYFNLAPVLANWNGVTTYEVHVCKDHEWDMKRAATLEATPHLSIHCHPGNKHAVASEMAKLKLLDLCFKNYNGMPCEP
jgi:tetratricopeptide (TPR) repeat protein